ncbi:putative tail assembly k domain protein, partial [Escherichia coli 95.0183]
MVGIPEQRVTVRHPVLKAPSCQMWHTAEFMNFP